jgi:hypothetical protein
MITVFSSIDDYVAALNGLPINDGEAYCVSYVPSCFFPKDSMRRFFHRYERAKNAEKVARALSDHNRRLIRALKNKTAKLCIESRAIITFCGSGVVHEATPAYELGFSERLHVLNEMKSTILSHGIFITSEYIPYVFRLHPPDVVLIGVIRYVSEQKIHGLFIQDQLVYGLFQAEFDRLCLSAQEKSLESHVNEAIEAFANGENYIWR